MGKVMAVLKPKLAGRADHRPRCPALVKARLARLSAPRAGFRRATAHGAIDSPHDSAGFIQELLARVDIVDVVGGYVKLKKAGANFLGLCPFHGEKSPSFTVSPTKQFYHCFGCGAHGSAIGFLMEHAGLSYVDAIHELAQSVGLQVPRRARDPGGERPAQDPGLLELLATAAKFYRQRLRDSPRAIDYLKGRGLTGETAARFGIGYAPDGWRSLQAAVPTTARVRSSRPAW